MSEHWVCPPDGDRVRLMRAHEPNGKFSPPKRRKKPNSDYMDLYPVVTVGFVRSFKSDHESAWRTSFSYAMR